jgi:arylsulfatase A-like enzyme
MYPPDKMPLPKNFMPEHPFDNGEMKVRDEMLAPHPRTPEIVRKHLSDYYAVITCLDAQIGRMLMTLKETGQLENTYIIFTSDQGLAIGSHGLFGKQNLYEHYKPPCIICGPGIKPGRSDALVYLHDLYPTMCEMAGAAIPKGVEGQSLVPILRGQKPKLRDSLFEVYKNVQRMARDERWKLIWYPHINKFQLFDLANDPDELKNLADEPHHAGRLAEMKKLLARSQQEAGDPGPRCGG